MNPPEDGRVSATSQEAGRLAATQQELDRPPPAPPQPDIEPAASDTEPTQPEPPPSIESRPVTQPDPSPVPPIPAPRADGELVLVLTTHRECWLRTSVDGGSPSERTVAANQTVVLRAKQEAQIRIGDAAAVSLTINDRPTNSLGRDGQVVSLRVTPDNFQSFLANGP